MLLTLLLLVIPLGLGDTGRESGRRVYDDRVMYPRNEDWWTINTTIGNAWIFENNNSAVAAVDIVLTRSDKSNLMDGEILIEDRMPMYGSGRYWGLFNGSFTGAEPGDGYVIDVRKLDSLGRRLPGTIRSETFELKAEGSRPDSVKGINASSGSRPRSQSVLSLPFLAVAALFPLLSP